MCFLLLSSLPLCDSSFLGHFLPFPHIPAFSKSPLFNLSSNLPSSSFAILYHFFILFIYVPLTFYLFSSFLFLFNSSWLVLQLLIFPLLSTLSSFFYVSTMFCIILFSAFILLRFQFPSSSNFLCFCDSSFPLLLIFNYNFYSFIVSLELSLF